MSVYKQKEDDLDKIFYDLTNESDEEEEEEQEQQQQDGEEVELAKDDLEQPNIIDDTTATSTADTGNVSIETIQETPNERVFDIDDDNEEVILIDDEDDDWLELDRDTNESQSAEHPPNAKATSVDLSFDDSINNSKTTIDYDFNLKVLVSGILKQVKTTYRTPLHLALKEMVAELGRRGKSLIVYTDTNEPLSLDESPHSLKLTPGNILNAIEVSQAEPSNQQTKETMIEVDPDLITLKLQDGHLRHLKEFKINKHERLFKLKEMYAQQFDIEISTMRLNFDGDPVEDEATAEELDIEDGCVLDVLVSRTN